MAGSRGAGAPKSQSHAFASLRQPTGLVQKFSLRVEHAILLAITPFSRALAAAKLFDLISGGGKPRRNIAQPKKLPGRVAMLILVRYHH